MPARTSPKAALAVAKNGKVLGRPNSDIYKHAQKGGATAAVNSRARITKRSADFLPILEAIKAEGNTSLRQIAAALNERGIATARGKQWTSVQVLRLLKASAPGRARESGGCLNVLHGLVPLAPIVPLDHGSGGTTGS